MSHHKYSPDEAKQRAAARYSELHATVQVGINETPVVLFSPVSSVWSIPLSIRPPHSSVTCCCVSSLRWERR